MSRLPKQQTLEDKPWFRYLRPIAREPIRYPPSSFQQKRQRQEHQSTGGKLRAWVHLLSFWWSPASWSGGTFGPEHHQGLKNSCSPCCRFRILPAIPIRNIVRTV